MTSFEWFLLIVVVIVVPLTIAVVVTLWTIDQANKRKRANRKDAQIGVKRKAALTPEEAAARKAARAEKQAEADSAGVAVVANSSEAPSSVDSSTIQDTPPGDFDSQPGDSPADVDTSTPDSSDSGSSGDSGSDSSTD